MVYSIYKCITQFAQYFKGLRFLVYLLCNNVITYKKKTQKKNKKKQKQKKNKKQKKQKNNKKKQKNKKK